MRPAELAHVAGAEARLLARVTGLTDAEAAAPSLLPDWSRAELLTHLARNADSFRGMAEGAMRGEVVEQYPGGREQRDAGIAAGRGRPAAEVVGDLSRSVEWLHETWAAVPPDGWDERIAATVVARWTEVEVHHADLGLGASAEDWPVPFVEAALNRIVNRLPLRAAADLPDARWVFWADDLALAWVVSSLAGQVSVARFNEDDPPPDVIVRGPGAQVLSELLNRQAIGLSISGEGRLFARFAELFPGP
jgi:maleylpyruvate isomerase